MENPHDLLEKVLAFARESDIIDAVILTGSRGRNARVDRFSDLDLELIMTSNDIATHQLWDSDVWLTSIGPVLVSIHLANGGDGEPDWPTCLAVFAGGRKIDFTLAGPLRIERMRRSGLDATYTRGFTVLLDKSGITRELPTHTPARPAAAMPSSDEVDAHQREFWFEATQVPIYVARDDLWPAQLRLAEMREQLLVMSQWMVTAPSPSRGQPERVEGQAGVADTWHNGHHLGEWLPEPYSSQVAATFALYTQDSIGKALLATIDLYDAVAKEACAKLGFVDLALRDRVLAHVERVISPETDLRNDH
ncbi:aminoglycoside 6-adenylyltransferase [Lysinibacter cavernae]|uniref:Aminoglycoside 6-adenylyltransferase n=1 Tax=Lysinibacter cavernae TaxID=1640652 RepID=A0A7X5R365_9MICO|nr:aminoglycoside 6-adenylyltransferase [Lysinibacter cavernae]NIH54731.1 aminoglycoside 6-adenylyltransferase [Lysinibacter cavernae]